MPCGTRAALAAHCGVNKSTVTRWDQAGKVVWTDDGLIDFEKTLALVESSGDPAKLGVKIRHEREREQKHGVGAFVYEPSQHAELPKRESAIGPAVEASASGSDYEAYNRARAKKAEEDARTAKMKREQQEGLLIYRETVKRDIEALAVIVSKGLTGIPARVMPLINGEADPGKREALLEEQIRHILNEFADAALTLQQE